ncbi:aldo/keto reductase [Nocardioides sp.]|uniref:aldo/keto reductase n=1 Tax=Nocardioides sp. TaxID=35761 RepID=UPI0027329E99|nr:aldo/keto reductase [Nocardioides sp.]MDP3894479.1 aldo/keto reductase [Nocardioides sp.]
MTPLWMPDHPPRQGLGLMRLRDSDPDRDPVTLVHTALDCGITLLDTAEMYGNEELVGRTIAGRRDEVTICSKFGVRWGDSGRRDDWSVHADAATVVASCENSLRRLGVETIDLYYLHHRSEETPIEETVTAMAGLVAAGKIRAVGLSNVTVDDVRRAHAVHPVLAVQEQWSLASRDVEAMLPTLAELGVTLVAHSPTGHGVLHRDTNTPLGAALAEVARTHMARPGQVALAWVHHQGRLRDHPVVPLPGTTSVAHLQLNLAAADLQLTDADLARLEAVS